MVAVAVVDGMTSMSPQEQHIDTNNRRRDKKQAKLKNPTTRINNMIIA